MNTLENYLENLRSTDIEITAEHAFSAIEEGALLIDIREASETENGTPAGALHLTRGFLDIKIGEICNQLDRCILLICASGTRSLLAVKQITQLGYTSVYSIAGGYQAWVAAALPTEIPEQLTKSEEKRYSRHIRIPEVGVPGQLRLKNSKILLIGCGGLGSPSAMYLAAAGVGHLTLVDFDTVDETNLQRQILFRETDIGNLKVSAAMSNLANLNSSISVHAVSEKLSPENVDALVNSHDVIIDGTDNFSARYIINDACVRARKPLIHGSIFRFDGQVSVFHLNQPASPCYRCIYPERPPAHLAPSCMDAGVLGVLPGVVGALQATECLKIILNIGSPLVGTLLVYDALYSSFTKFKVERNSHCSCSVVRNASHTDALSPE